LTPGPYSLRLLQNGPNGYHIVGEQQVNLTDEDVSGVVITPFKPAQVRVRVVLDGEEDKPLIKGVVSLRAA
jgi:hypothetical protein